MLSTRADKKENDLLEIRDLHVTFTNNKRNIPAVQGVDLTLRPGSVVGLVGESGCGKSVLSLTVMDLLDKAFATVNGSVRFMGQELLGLTEKEINQIRGSRMSMIFQEPMTSLNPVLTVEQQMTEVILTHRKFTKEEAQKLCITMLNKVGLPDPERIAHGYPHTLSGGQRQRVMIAMALCCQPALLIADEPTTALDVTIQAQVLELIRTLQSEMGTAILFISHDLGVIAEMADYVYVMYAGRIVETGSVYEIFDNPTHPYTLGLMASRTSVDNGQRAKGGGRKLPSIAGNVPSPDRLPEGCSFWPRCSRATEECKKSMPELKLNGDNHWVRCVRINDTDNGGES